MGIGHVAVGLSLKRADPSINAGWLIFAAMLPDFLLGWFVWAEWETYQIPADYGTSHYLLFTFPWSHGLVADLVWAGLAGSIALLLARRRAAGLTVAFAVLSHFLLDGIVHVKGPPLLAEGGAAFGLGLWRQLPVELGIEAGMVAVGLWIYWSSVKSRAIGMTIFVVLLGAFLIFGQAGATAEPPREGLIASWLMLTPAIAAIGFWLDRRNGGNLLSKSGVRAEQVREIL